METVINLAAKDLPALKKAVESINKQGRSSIKILSEKEGVLSFTVTIKYSFPHDLFYLGMLTELHSKTAEKP